MQGQKKAKSILKKQKIEEEEKLMKRNRKKSRGYKGKIKE